MAIFCSSIDAKISIVSEREVEGLSWWWWQVVCPRREALASKKVTLIIRVYILLCIEVAKVVYPVLVPLSGHPMNNKRDT